MRLPGTINVPDAKKIKKGRVARTARLVEYNDNVYPLTAFMPARAVQGAKKRAGGAVKISGTLSRVDLGTLSGKIPANLKTIIVQGDDPENLDRFGGDRSKAVWHVCCELVWSGVDDDTIASILLDRELGISAHIYDQKRPVEYAARQIQRAREFAIDPALLELNEKHAVIMSPRTRVMTITPDPAFEGRERITYGSFDDFKNRYLNRSIPVGGDKEIPLGRWWLEHNKRRQYESVEFLPGRDREGVYNLWKGFACEAVAGDCSLFLDHVLNNVCCGHEPLYEYLLNWMAKAVQRPSEPGQVAVVLRGGRGTGKSFFAQTFGSLFWPAFSAGE